MTNEIGTAIVKIKPVIERVESSIVKDEPVIVGHLALFLLALVGEFLVGHHIIGTQQWTTDQDSLIPIVTAVLLSLSAWATRSVVTPVNKAISKAINDTADEVADPAPATVTSGTITAASTAGLNVTPAPPTSTV